MTTKVYGVTTETQRLENTIYSGPLTPQFKKETLKANAGVMEEMTVLERHADTGLWEKYDSGTGVLGVLGQDVANSNAAQDAIVLRMGMVNATKLILAEGKDIDTVINLLADNNIYAVNTGELEDDDS